MPTFTLTGTIPGDTAASRSVYVQFTTQVTNDAGDESYRKAYRYEASNGVFTIPDLPSWDPLNLPYDADAPQFGFVVSTAGLKWTIPAQETGAEVDVSDFAEPWSQPVAPDLAAQVLAARDEVLAKVDANDDLMATVAEDTGSDFRGVLDTAFAGRAAGMDVRALGAKADELSAVCSITNGSNVLTRSSGAWTADDVGKVLSVPNAMATADLQSRNTMPAKITGFTDATHVTLDRTAGATATGVTVLYATDNTVLLQAALDDAYTNHTGDTFIFPKVGKPFYVDMLMPHSHQKIYGPGEVKQIPRNWNDDPIPATKQGGTIMPWNVPGSTVDITEHVLVEGLYVNGNKGAHYGSIANRTHGEGINFKYGVKCVAAYNVIWDTNGDGIDRDHCTDSLILGNHAINASCWGYHTSEGNVGCRLIGNTATNCGWDLFVETGVSAGGFDCSQDSSKITYIGNVADGCRINYALGNSGLYDPAVYQLIAVGNRERSDAATPAYASSYQAVIPDIPDSITKSIDFTLGLLAHAEITGIRSTGTSVAYSAWVSGDTASRFSITGAGTMAWGDGTNAKDVSLFRSSADTLRLNTGDSFQIQGGGYNNGHMLYGSNHVWFDASGIMRTQASAPATDTAGQEIGGPLSGTTANFAAIGNTRNTIGKYAGRPGWNSTLNRPIWSTGSTAGAVWVFADGTTAHTPI